MFRQALPHWFPEPMPWVHRGIVAIMLRHTDFLLNFGKEMWEEREYEWTETELDKLVRYFTTPIDPDDPDGPKREIFTVHYDGAGRPTAIDLVVKQHVALVIPRGFSKTTIINACNVYEVLFKTLPFLVYVSKAEGHAADQLGTILKELRTNDGLVAVFGQQVPRKQDLQKTTNIDIELYNGVRITVRGSNAQIRGMNKDAIRPHHIVLDDVETTISVESETQTTKNKKWLYSDILLALPRKKGVGRVTLLGTFIANNMMLTWALETGDFTPIVFGALTDDGEPLWEFAMSKEDIEDKRKKAAKNGMLREFNLELMSDRKTQVDKKFAINFPEIIKPMHWSDFEGRAVCIDPASSKKKTSDPTALAVVGMTPRGRLHVLDFTCRVGMSPREQVDEYFKMHFKWQCTHHGVETVAYQAALKFLIEEEMARFSNHFGSSAFFKIDAITHGHTRKIARVELALATRYSAGYITHQQKFPELESQLDLWPNDKLDGPDVVAMAVNLLAPLSPFAVDDEELILGEQTLTPLDNTYFPDAEIDAGIP